MTITGADGNLTLTEAGAQYAARARPASCINAVSRTGMPKHRRCAGTVQGWRAPSSAGAHAHAVEAMAWRWSPAGCRLAALSLEELPAWLAARHTRLVFGGTSLTTDWAEGLWCTYPSLGQTHLVAHRMNDAGVAKETAGSENAQATARERWRKYLEHNDTLVIDAGAHWYGTLERAHAAHLVLARALWELQPRAIIFRTTVQGHKGCARFTRPFTSLSAEQKAELASEYNWQSFGALNDVIIGAFSEVWPASRFHVLNISMFEFRGDGHAVPTLPRPDCLHYCSPGAASEWWGRLLAHVLASAWPQIAGDDARSSATT